MGSNCQEKVSKRQFLPTCRTVLPYGPKCLEEELNCHLHVIIIAVSSSVYTVEPDDKFDSLPNMNNDIHGKMSKLVIMADSIYSKLCDLNISKSPGPDMLHPGVLYKLKDVIAYPLFLICNKSMQCGKVSADWK